MKAELLDLEFKPRGIEYSTGRVLLLPVDAIALVNRAADEGVPILSVDAFHVNTAPVESRLEHFIDFSEAAKQGHGCWEEADAFIRERSDLGFLFEIALGGDPIEAV
jgi:hypothetical protein